jgi:hypothetical protein
MGLMTRQRTVKGGAEDRLVIALDTYHVDSFTVIEGKAYRASDEVVRLRPEAFIDADSSDVERGKAHSALMQAERRRVGLP